MSIEVHEKEFGMSRDKLYEELKKYNIHARRYFYPPICDYSCYRSVFGKGPIDRGQKSCLPDSDIADLL